MIRYIGILLLVLAATLSGCIYDYDLESSYVEGATAYISIAVNTGDKPRSRDGEELDHGAEAEYTIQDAFLLLFEGADYEHATFAGGFVIWDPQEESGQTTHISRRYKANVTLFDFQKSTGSNYYGIIVANTNNGFYATRDAIYFYDESGSYRSHDGFTIAEFCGFKMHMPDGKQPAGYFADSQNHVFMTNAQLYSDTGKNAADAANTTSDKIIPVALEVTGKITSTPIASPTANEIAEFYVERAAAKVRLKSAATFTLAAPITKHIGSTSSVIDEVTVTFNGWTLVNLSPHSYIMRNWDTSWPVLYTNAFEEDEKDRRYRFLGTTTEESGKSLFRTYFCMSSTYGSTSDYNGLSTALRSSITSYTSDRNPYWKVGWKNSKANVYCLENTFPVEGMMVKNATHALVKVTMPLNVVEGVTSDFYILNGDKSEVYDIDAIKSKIQANAKIFAGLVNLPTISMSEASAHGGECTVTLALADGETDDEEGNPKTTKLAEYCTLVNVQCYKGGNVYYLLPISHFGDYYTPWNATETDPPHPIDDAATDDATNIGNSYPAGNRDRNYLGRWGVVRNCWYDIHITGVSAIGDPTDYTYYPDLINGDNTPLDHYRSVIQAKLQVKDWILRNQSFTIITP